MTYRETCVLLPCHSLEDFPLHHDGDDADGLLAAWTALWHPALVAATGSAPTWHRSDNAPLQLTDMLLLVPGVSLRQLPADFAERAEREGAVLIQGNHTREALLDQALAPVADLAQAVDGELAADFLALGYCYLQVELLTRQMRYSTSLDELHFFKQMVSAAQAAVAGEEKTARDQLAACFDLLAQERDHYYAVDAYVLDLVLVGPTTIGPSLRAQLAPGVPLNLLLDAELLAAIERDAPDSLSAIRRGVQEGYAALIGGELSQQRSPLLSCETVLNQFRRGLQLLQRFTGQRPKVFGRRRFGLSILYPQLLNRLGYVGAIHAVLSQGKCPEGTQLKIRWQGPDHCAIDAISRTPLDAARPATFLSLASKLGETMDIDHVATICLAHWPGRTCTWYDDLRRIARYGHMLGKFVTADDYFRDTDYPGQTEQFKADQYQSPDLTLGVAHREPNPISSSVRYWRRRSLLTAQQAHEMMMAAITRRGVSASSDLIDQLDGSADQPCDGELDDQIEALRQQTTHGFATLLPRREGDAQPGYLVLNPASHVRRIALDLPQLPHLPSPAAPVYAVDDHPPYKHVVVDVPSMGFAWLTAGQPAKSSGRGPQALADDGYLFNEFLEAHINPASGALQGLVEYGKRGNRLSALLALRMPRQTASGQRKATYSSMVADCMEVTAATAVLGEISVQGRLVGPEGEELALYRQQFRVWRGSRVLHWTIELEPRVALTDDPWNSYFCCRYAWANESAQLWRTVNQIRDRAEAKRLEAPNYLEIDDDGHRTVVLTGGLPYHRRTDPRMLDTLLIVAGEEARRFELGLGLDVKYPLQESLAFMTPVVPIPSEAPPMAGPSSSWLFHIDSRNLVATAWSPLVEQDRVVGFLVRLLETAGRAAHAKLQSCIPIVSARRRDFTGENMGSCTIESGAAVVDISAHCWVEVEARW